MKNASASREPVFLAKQDPVWRKIEEGRFAAVFSGREATVRELLGRLPENGRPSAEQLEKCLAALPGHYAAWIEAPGYSLAAVDSVRSIPLFYTLVNGSVKLSNDARSLCAEFGLVARNTDSLLEFFLAGYTTGNSTLIEGLSQLRAGEALVCGPAGENPEFLRYYVFYERTHSEAGEADLALELAAQTDAIFDRLVEDLDGRPVWVPLSAGLDSRLIACKLAERKYPRVQTFSYGIPGNQEAKYARKVAGSAGLPWLFVNVPSDGYRDFFLSDARKVYWRYSDCMCSVPNLQDIVPLLDLKAGGLLPEDAVIVNGQSGDFMTGGHLPAVLAQDGTQQGDVFGLMIRKHFALWTDIMNEPNLAGVRARLDEQARSIDAEFEDFPAAMHDCLEWQERQAKYVVNGQRVYDFLGLDWRLPLWEDEYMRFWPGVPVRLRLGQRLYLKYLSDWNYKDLFRTFRPEVSHWPGRRKIFFLLAQVAGLAGRRNKDLFYAYARYFGHYGYLWSMLAFSDFMRGAAHARNVVSFMADIWAEEHFGPGINHGIYVRAGGSA